VSVSPQIAEIPTATVVIPAAEGLVFAEDGSGILLGPESLPLRFPSVATEGIEGLFPSYLPNAEQIVWDALNDATQSCLFFPEDDDPNGLTLPLTFSTPPDIGLFTETDPETYPQVAGIPNNPIKVVRGWPTYPGAIPQIGVAIATENEDGAGRLGQGGFAGDAFATDQDGNIVASAAYYAEPLYSVIVVELIHENRDERDRLHDQLRRRLYPLRHLVPASSAIVKELQVQSEKQDLPVDEQPNTLYISVFTVEVWTEALIPTEVQINPAIINAINVTVQIEA
jgi:hypothetical protein